MVARRLVSKKKRRLQRDGFELDLSYIWPQPASGTGHPPSGSPARVITMGFPAENGAVPEAPTYAVGEQERAAMALGGFRPVESRTSRQGGGRFDAWFRNPMHEVCAHAAAAGVLCSGISSGLRRPRFVSAKRAYHVCR
jgi:hypothetical protein